MKTLERAENREVTKGQVWRAELRFEPSNDVVTQDGWRFLVWRAGTSAPRQTLFTERKTHYSRAGGFTKAKEQFLRAVTESGLQRTLIAA